MSYTIFLVLNPPAKCFLSSQIDQVWVIGMTQEWSEEIRTSRWKSCRTTVVKLSNGPRKSYYESGIVKGVLIEILGDTRCTSPTYCLELRSQNSFEYSSLTPTRVKPEILFLERLKILILLFSCFPNCNQWSCPHLCWIYCWDIHNTSSRNRRFRTTWLW